MAALAVVVILRLVVVVIALRVAMLVSGAASSSSAIVPASRARVTLGAPVAQSLTATGHTKTSIVGTLKILADAGMIKDVDGVGDADVRALKRKLTVAATAHGNVQTKYGTVIQKVKLDAKGVEYWEYMNPFAFLCYCSSLSHSFASMMRSICDGVTPLRIIIYADGLVPGNPFRPEASRKLQCIYWCIADWPQHVLQRSFAWPVFSIIRESVIESIGGGLGKIMRTVLNIFFGNVGHSFTRGVHINDSDGGFVVTAIFAGFLQDLLGHKELSDWKGTNGVLCCITCDNVINMQHRRPGPGQVASNCWDATKFVYRDNERVYHIIDNLKAEYDRLIARPRWSATAWDNAQKAVGFNLAMEGLLMDMDLRGIYKPVDHTIRDWMHTIAQDGVANTHVAALLHRLAERCNLSLARVQDFSQLVHYPSKHGKLERAAFGAARLRNNTIASFSSIMLTMVSVLHLFVDVFAAALIPEEFEAFTKLHHIIGILQMGPEDAMCHVGTLRTLIAQHLESYCRLYDEYVKPKMHHLFHVPDGMAWVGKLLSCFVTERKHKMIKRAALYVFRHIEHTVLCDVVNTTFQQIIDGHDLYTDAFLLLPHDCNMNGMHFRTSRAACLRVGHVAVGDLVIRSDGLVGCVVKFWQRASDNHIALEVDAYPCVNNDIRYVSTAQSTRDFFDHHSIVDCLIWFEDSPALLRIAVPPALLYLSP